VDRIIAHRANRIARAKAQVNEQRVAIGITGIAA
jgi:hypothetical protein